ncbi:TlyA family RNA methyltransferase [Rothia kristinae]|uniref:TlyA family RNA methyltransferase n=1 Tax=Rothia kristinae TaxID=37923 RepID=UPI0022DEB978|nr:TlyA family RNA methyltransferase [Rothia kristinae]
MRLDQHLVHAGLAPSRTAAARLIREGRVLVRDRKVRKPALDVAAEAPVRILPGTGADWVSRAGHKLDGALRAFPDVVVAGRRCLDAGASTGGFTQVLLHRGAARVVAVDVGHDQLHPSLRADPRVLVYEGLNVRHLDPEAIGGPVQLTVGDLSFISLTLVLPALRAATAPGGELVLMVKPQFEVGRAGLDKHGVVRDEATRQAGIRAVLEAAADLGLQIRAAADSTLPGQDGNREHFLHLRRPTADLGSVSPLA